MQLKQRRREAMFVMMLLVQSVEILDLKMVPPQGSIECYICGQALDISENMKIPLKMLLDNRF